MSRAASYSSVSGQPRTFAIAGSLLLVSVSYVLLLSAPVITRHLRSVVSGVGGVKAFEWLPLACGAGLVLGGASALVFVLTQIAREAERRPYICLAPVLAAFAACILIGLRAELPLKGVASEQVAVFGLALSVVGGSLVQTSRVSAQMMGLAFTFMPPLSLFVVLWTLSGRVDPAQVVWGLSAPSRAFMGMLTLSSFAIAGVATLGRQSGSGLSARLPRDQDKYVLYELEDDLMADEARMRQRGLPGWVIVLAAAAAVALGFMALKVFLERRAALNFLAPSTPASAPANSLPAVVAPPASEPAAPGPSELEPGAPVPSEPAPRDVTPALVPVSDEAPKAADAPDAARAAGQPDAKLVPEQPLHAHIPLQPLSARAPEGALRPAHELSRSAAAKAVAHGSARAPHKLARPERKSAAPARVQPAAKPAPVHVEKPAPAQSLRAEKSALALVPKAEPKPVEAKKPTKPQSVADLAVQAAALAAPTRPSKAGQDAKPASNDGLDELMDNVLKPEKGSKKQKANDDPIYGL